MVAAVTILTSDVGCIAILLTLSITTHSQDSVSPIAVHRNTAVNVRLLAPDGTWMTNRPDSCWILPLEFICTQSQPKVNKCTRRRDSSVGVVTGLRLDNRETVVRLPAGEGD